MNLPAIHKIVSMHRSSFPGSEKKKNIFTRQLCCFYAIILTDCKLVEIGRYFGYANHTAALYGRNQINNYIDTEPDIWKLVSKISMDIRLYQRNKLLFYLKYGLKLCSLSKDKTDTKRIASVSIKNLIKN